MKLNKFKFKFNKKNIMDITYVVIILLVFALYYYVYKKSEKYENFYQPLWVQQKAEKLKAEAELLNKQLLEKEKEKEKEKELVAKKIAENNSKFFNISIPKLW
jgi:Ni,Fe-hydrogenase I cytochrome b subunit